MAEIAGARTEVGTMFPGLARPIAIRGDGDRDGVGGHAHRITSGDHQSERGKRGGERERTS